MLPEKFVLLSNLCIFVVVMRLFRNPIVWFLRFRCRKGYGIHSPFAFSFVTDVLYCKEEYYAYEQLDRGLRWWQKGRERDVRHLAFRLANYRRPRTLYCPGLDTPLSEACQCGSREARLIDASGAGVAGVADMIFVPGADETVFSCIGEGTMVVVDDIRSCRAFWERIKADGRITVTFDLYDIGIAFARRDLNRQHYKINW